MNRRKSFRLITLLIMTSLLISITGCSGSGSGTTSGGKQVNLMEGVGESRIYSKEASDSMEENLENGGALIINKLGINLLKDTGLQEGTNSLISPLSVIYALGMTTNGAEEETLSGMLKALDAESSDQLNEYLRAYLNAVSMKSDTDPGEILSIANSIWFREDDSLTVLEDFLNINRDYYDAGIYELPFDDDALKTINSWIEDHTGGLIKDMLKEIPEAAIMFLVNALSFDAEWEEPYDEYSVNTATFHGDSGDAEVDMMYGSEYDYLEDENATGFAKYYKGRNYYFAALLPNEGMTVDEYVDTLTGEKLHDILSNHNGEKVNTGLPKFETKYSVSLKETLISMGMDDAFDEVNANFQGLGTLSGDRNIYIGDVLHNTFIKVDEKGTQAGAATVVAMMESAMEMEEPKTVILDRPFVYMLVDSNENIPIFIGVLREM